MAKKMKNKYDIDTLLKVLWVLKTEDKFYFMTYGRDMLGRLIQQVREEKRP